TLKELWEALGERKITCVRELTKKHEETFCTTISEAILFYEEHEPKGEFVLVVEGRTYEELQKEEQEQWKKMSLVEHMNLYLNKGMNKKEAMKAVSLDRGVTKREIYQSLLEED
ncbi:MAG: rsmI, partial [Anaerocolumna sp.]|nr:rsmI [Anaerocolumna sp.]